MLDNASTGSAQNALATKTLAKMSPEDLDELALELDLIRDDILSTLGKDDADYLRRLLKIQRGLDVAGRVTLLAGLFPPAWFAGVGLLALAKILENMEIGHNVMHGQWDWMRDPDIHSTTWEWDNVCPSEQWRHSHNYLHHQWTNVDGMDKDIGYGIFRVHASQEWRPEHLAQPAIFVILAVLFEYGISVHDNEGLHFGSGRSVDLELARPKLQQTWEKIRSQAAKDFVWFPLLAAPLGLPSVVATATGAAAANVIRNVWSFSVIFCGHFPDGVSVFTPDEVENETRGGWYFRQILGSANFTGGRVVNVLSGNLNHQIEHHLFPDLPSNRYAEIAPKVEEICERRGIPYNTGSFVKQLGSVVNKIVRLSVPFGR